MFLCRGFQQFQSPQLYRNSYALYENARHRQRFCHGGLPRRRRPALLAEAKQQAIFLCDRKFGVGGDGVIVLLPGQNAEFEMRMFNPDGSESEMCGNGIRCFAKYLYDRGLTHGSREITVQTGAGRLHLQVTPGPDHKAATVRVDMGEPVLKPSQIPTVLAEGDAPIINALLEAGNLTLGITAVSMGNPHAVTFVDDVQSYPH